MASGNTLLIFTPQSMMVDSNAQPDYVVRNDHLVLAFNDATDETAYCPFVLPRHYDGGGITITIYWSADTATTGNVVWAGAFERHEQDVQDLDADSFAADQTVTAGTASVAGELDHAAIAFTNGAQMDSLAVGESGRLRITRDANNGSDTLTGDAQVLRVEVRET